jgi:radical SAM superfamily enzyme YgiQ (UPF0313 family)
MGKNLNVVFIRINSVADEIIPPLHYGYLAASLPRSCNVSSIDMLRDNMDEECFIIGFPGETKEDILQTIKYSKTLELDRIGISYFQPYPGTKEYDDLVKCGKFSYDITLMKLSLHTINYINDNLTKRQLYWLRRKAFIAFYFRWKIVVKLLKEVRNLEHMMFILKRAMLSVCLHVGWIKARGRIHKCTL